MRMTSLARAGAPFGRLGIVNVTVEDTPLVAPEHRLDVEKLGKGFYTVRVHHGFFETPDVPQALREAQLEALTRR